jgi:hypothetical protein
VMRERRVWRILSCLSTPCEMPSFIVWMMAGIAERKTARGDEGLEGAEGNSDNFQIFVAESMRMGRVPGRKVILESEIRTAGTTTMRCLSEPKGARLRLPCLRVTESP